MRLSCRIFELLIFRSIAFRWIDCKSDDGYTAVQWEAAQVNPARDRRFGNMQRHMMLGIQLRGKKYDKHYPQARRLSPTNEPGQEARRRRGFLSLDRGPAPLLKQGAPSERHAGRP